MSQQKPLSLKRSKKNLRVKGRDAVEFLNRMLSADIKSLTQLKKVSMTESFLCEANGRILSFFEVYFIPDEGLFLSFEVGDELKFLENIEKYIFSEDISFAEDPSSILNESFLLSREKNSERNFIRHLAPYPLAKDYFLEGFEDDEGILFEHSMSPSLALRYPGESSHVESAPSSEDFLIEKSLEEKFPIWGVSMKAGDLPVFFPCSMSFSFDKGCFCGQEVIAKATQKGRPPFLFSEFHLEQDFNTDKELKIMAVDGDKEFSAGKLRVARSKKAHGLIRSSLKGTEELKIMINEEESLAIEKWSFLIQADHFKR